MEENRFLKHFLLRKYCFSHFFSIFGQNNYNKITIMNNKRDYLHRHIMDAPKGCEVDHIDHDRMNNCRNNLRICTHQQNQ